MTGLPPKHSVLGTPISSTRYSEVVRCIIERSPSEALVVVCCNVHSVMSARSDPAVLSALSTAQIATPDGMPLVWALRSLYGVALEDRVYGPDLMLETMDRGRAVGLRHYLFGATEDTLGRLTKVLRERLEGLVICGKTAPPFVPVDQLDVDEIARQVKASRADVLWLGLGMPKQELLMKRLSPLLPGLALVGVGAAFDFHAGTVRQAPRWMQARGLEWLFRLSREPRRLAGRYLLNNPAFVCLFAVEYVRTRWAR